MPYVYHTPPYDHQKDILAQSWNRQFWGLLGEMGTGKSKILIDNAAGLYEHNRIDAMLIVAPKGVYTNWYGEIETHMPTRIPRRVVHFEAGKYGPRKIEDYTELAKYEGMAILLVNIEALKLCKPPRRKGQKWEWNKAARLIGWFLNKRRVLCAVDESTCIANHRANQSKAMTHLGRGALYRRILTGSSFRSSPGDIYSQCAFLHPNALGFNSYYAFKKRYVVTESISVFSKKTNKKVKREVEVGTKNIEELSHKYREFTSRILKKDCLDLPPKIYMQREVELTPEQKKAYAEIKDFAYTELQGKEVSVSQVVTQLLRLHQVVCGHVGTDDREVVPLPHNRINVLADILVETEGKVIIWAHFTHALEDIIDYLQKTYGYDSVVEYRGQTSVAERERAKERFQDPDDPARFFVGNPATGGFGITLTQARTVVYYANSFKLEERLQSEDRPHRIGQHFPVTYIDIVAKGTIDWKILKTLRRKLDVASAIQQDGYVDWLI